MAPENVMLAHTLCNNRRGNAEPFCMVPRLDPAVLNATYIMHERFVSESVCAAQRNEAPLGGTMK